jgi:signal transduction histidine kinase
MSVRARTTLAATLVVIAALFTGSVILVRTLEHSLTTASDQQTRIRLAELVDQAHSGTLPEVLRGVGDDSLVQIVDARGRVLGASANITRKPAIASLASTSTRPRVRTMRDLPDDQETEDYRIWSRRTSTPDGEVAIFLGPSLETVRQVIDRLIRILALGLPVLVLLLGLAIWATVGRALRPVERIRGEVAGFGPRSWERRVEVPATHDEVALLAITMNAMLDRLEDADRRQREFVANASHDLKSPLTIMRTELEAVLAGDDPTRALAGARAALAETDRMEALVGDLLFLAGAEDGVRPTLRPLDLEGVVADEIARIPPGGPVEVRLTATGAPVSGSNQDLARMVRNLMQNALGFARTSIEVAVGEQDGQAVLSVSDDGPGVGDQHRDEVFGRFVTLDDARDRRTGGTGLGLAIARTIAESHGGTLTLEGPSPTSRFVVRLPLLE